LLYTICTTMYATVSRMWVNLLYNPVLLAKVVQFFFIFFLSIFFIIVFFED
jgi:hypothetical protein